MDVGIQALVGAITTVLSGAAGVAGATASISKALTRLTALENRLTKLEKNTEDAESQSAEAKLSAALVLQAHLFIDEKLSASEKRLATAIDKLAEQQARAADDRYSKLHRLVETALEIPPTK